MKNFQLHICYITILSEQYNNVDFCISEESILDPSPTSLLNNIVYCNIKIDKNVTEPTFPAISSSFLSFFACPASIFISIIPVTAIIGTMAKSRRVSCQPWINDKTIPVPRLAIFWAISASLEPVAWKRMKPL